MLRSYKEFVDGLARDKFAGAGQQSKMKPRRTGDPLADPLSKLRPGVTPEDLVSAHSMVRERLLTKYDTVHKAFKYAPPTSLGLCPPLLTALGAIWQVHGPGRIGLY